METISSSDSEKPNGNNNAIAVETSQDELGQVINEEAYSKLGKSLEPTVTAQEELCSQSLFSQETPELDEITTNVHTVISSETSSKSSDVTHVTQPVEFIVLETDSSDKNSVITVSDSTETVTNYPLHSVRRKSSDFPSVPHKKTRLEEKITSDSSTNMDTATAELTPKVSADHKVHTLVKSYQSPRKNTSLSQFFKSSRRLKRSASVDVEERVKVLPPEKASTSSIKLDDFNKKKSRLTLRKTRAQSVDIQQRDNIFPEILSQDELGEYLNNKGTLSQMVNSGDKNEPSGRRNPVETIMEDTPKDSSIQNMHDSQCLNVSESQNMQLFLSPSFEIQNPSPTDVNENEPLLSQDLSDAIDNCKKVVLLSESNNVSNGDVHKSSNHESASSVRLDSPYDAETLNNPITKCKPYLSNGYSSSTPENGPITHEVLLKKTFHLSDSETDNTPPFSNFTKKPNADSKMSISSKSNLSDIRNNSSISLNNGHSNGSHNSSNPVPTFHIQMLGDENDNFLSLCIVKINSEMGAQTLREYQKLNKRLSADSYAGDVSKNTSPSSVTSGGMLPLPTYPRSSFMSSTSSSSTSSSRISDAAFIAPQRPRKNLSFHSPTTVKGWPGLKQSVATMLSNLASLDPAEEVVLSLSVNGDSKGHQTWNETDNKVTTNENEVTKNSSNDYSRTPKSSKKKLQPRTKRVLSAKTKKSELSVTNEEPQELTESISSPEMIPTDKCEQFQTPSRLKPSEESSKSGKSTPRGRKTKNGSVVLNLSTAKEDIYATPNVDQTDCIGTMVLAKWRDKKYYSGRIVNISENNKYEVKFYDGQVKSMMSDFIIFGNMTELPLKGQSVYTKVDDTTYEPSLVLDVEKNAAGEVLYKCTTDRNSLIAVNASDIYLTEDQAKSFNEDNPPKSPHSAPGTPRRRINRDLDLNNIIHESRSTRLRDRGTPKEQLSSPCSRPGTSAKRPESEGSECSVALEDADGIQPEMRATPIRGLRVDHSQIKGSSKQKFGKESKVKFETEEELAGILGPIPSEDSNIFSGLDFLLTCADIPISRESHKSSRTGHDSDSYLESSGKEDEMMLAKIPFIKKRVIKQLEMGGGKVYNQFEDVPKSKYSSCRLIVPTPCLTAKFIKCLAANIMTLSHFWVIDSCKAKKQADHGSYTLPTGYSYEHERMVALHDRNTSRPFQNKLIMICSENEIFTKFWNKVCRLAGSKTEIIPNSNMNLQNAIAIVTEANCPTEVINKADYDTVPLVSTTWIVQCLIEGKLLNVNANPKYMYNYVDD